MYMYIYIYVCMYVSGNTMKHVKNVIVAITKKHVVNDLNKIRMKDR